MQKTALKTLCIEDSKDDLDLVVSALKRGGLDPEVTQVQSAKELRECLKDSQWKIIISDFALPGFNGFEALKIVKEGQVDIPFIMVSGTIGEEVAVEAMRAGAHDYLMKDNLNRLVPVVLRELKDFEERKALQAEIANREELLRQAQKMEAIGSLAGGIAHDFNNILAYLLMASESLQNKIPKDHEVREELLQIQTSIERAAALTKQLLAFSRKQRSEPQAVDMNSMITHTQSMLSRLLGEKFKFNVDLKKTLAKVSIDPVQLEQVLMNLIVNARDAMPNGGEISIETSQVKLDKIPTSPKPISPAAEYTVLTVRDNGTGMDAETQKRIFEPFFTTKEVGKGTGLGLSTVFGIVNQSGGHIEVNSEPGKGTEFRVYLPVIGSEPATPAVEKPRDAAPTPAPAPVKTEKPRGSETILLVEDQAELRYTMREMLKKCGYNVLSAESVRDAILVESTHKEEIDILVTDLIMPERNGFELAQVLRTKRPALQVLIMSGYLDNRLIETKSELFQQHFLHKPFSSDELAKKIRTILDKGKARSES